MYTSVEHAGESGVARMNRRLSKGALLSVSLLYLCLVSCRDYQGEGDFVVESVNLEIPEGTTAYVPELDGPLRALSATPYGPMLSLAPEQVITVTFSRPMVPLGESPEVPSGVMSIEPSIPGKFYWDGSQTLVFRPESTLPPATAFHVKIAEGLSALNGDRLEEPLNWTFETPRPLLIHSEPHQDENYVDPKQVIDLHFNQGIKTNVAEQYIKLRPAQTEKQRGDVALSVSAQGDSALVVRPQRLLKQGTSYELLLLPGLPSVQGRLGMADTTILSFTTYDQLRITNLSQPRNYWEEEREDFDPGRGITVSFSTPVRFGDLRKSLSFSPAISFPVGIEAQDEVVSASHSLPFEWEPETRYTLTIQNLKDQFGQVLTSTQRSFRTRAYDPYVRVPEGIMIVEANEQASIPLRAVNVPEVRIGAIRLRQDDIIPVIRTYDPRHYYGEHDSNKQPKAVPANSVFPVNLQRNHPGTVAIRLDSLTTGGTGVVAMHVIAPQQGRERQNRAFLGIAQITRLGITAKFSAHQNLVFVTDLQTARPVAGALVTIRDLENRIRWQGRTDDRGSVVSPGWAKLNIKRQSPWESPIQFAMVQQGNDFAFTSSVYREGLEPYRFDINFDWRSEEVTETGSIFSDRGLYRVGEDVFLKGILRTKTDGEWQPIRDSIRVLISSPRNQIVLDRHLVGSDLGTFDLQWTTPPSSAQGLYTVRVVHARDTAAVRREYWDPGDIARGEFRVDAFRTATFAVTAHSSAENYVGGDFFEGSISGRYLFGADMTGQPVRYSLTRQPGSFTPNGFEDYRFGSFDYDFRHGGIYQSLVEVDTILGEGGTVRTRMQLPGNENGVPATLVWSGSVTDPARQVQGSRRSISLHPGLFYIGLKPRSTFLDLSRNQSMAVDVITVDPGGLPVGGQTVDIELLRQQWYSSREVGVDGRLVWRSEQTEERVGAHRIETESGKARRLTMPVTQGGSYIVRATTRDLRGNMVRTDAYFYATGEGYVAWERSDDDRIELIPEKREYLPGETARLMVQSPYEEATALITVEREGILSSRVETLSGSAPQIEIPLAEQHIPNTFVSVVLLNGRTARPGTNTDAGRPGFKIGYAELRVDPGSRHLRVEIKPDREQYRPGDEVTVDMVLRDASGRGVEGEIAFSAADAGVLNLIGYALPDPFDTFYGPRPLGVTTTESRSNLIEQRNYGQKEEDMIGGGGDRSFLLREDFRPLAHWEPSIRTDNRGRAQAKFKLPESLTTFRLMASALTGENEFGAGKTDILVTQPLVLQPALPRFSRLKDSFEAGVLISNLTGHSGTVTVMASGEGIQLENPTSQTFTINEGQTKEVRFGWRVVHPGGARLRFDAQLGSERDALSVPLTITLPTTRHASATFASTSETATEALRLPEGYIPGLGRFEARLSSTALVGLDGAARYLFEYPYGCLEQRTSAVRPLLIAGDILDAFDLDVLAGNRQEVIAQWLNDLNEFWTGQGFSLWEGNRYTHPYVSAYVVLAMAEAKASGFRLPEDFLQLVLDQLTVQVRKRSERPEYYSVPAWTDTRILMLYALARHGRIIEEEIGTLANEAVSRPGTVSVEGVSLLLRTIALTNQTSLQRYLDPLADYLKRQIRIESTTAYLQSPDDPEYDWIFSSNTRATAFGLAALVEVDRSDAIRQIAQRMVRYLMQIRREGHWASTQENVAVIDAFRVYFDAFESVSPDFTAEVLVAGKSLLEASFTNRSLKVEEVSRPLETLPQQDQVPIEISKNGTGEAYYSLLLETYSSAPQPSAEHGIRIERRIQRLDDRGQPHGETFPTGAGHVTLRAGELVRVTLRISSPTERNYVVVDDALPAGLEALNAAFETTDQTVLETARAGEMEWWGSFNHIEIHDDRVLLFADYLRRGEHTYTYVARATTPGTFVHPPAQTSMMYAPETFGRTATGTLVIQTPGSR